MEEQKSYNIIGSANIATTELIPSSDTSEVPILADKIVNIFVTFFLSQHQSFFLNFYTSFASVYIALRGYLEAFIIFEELSLKTP